MVALGYPRVEAVPIPFHLTSLRDWYTSPNVFVLVGRTLICRGHGVKVEADRTELHRCGVPAGGGEDAQ